MTPEGPKSKTQRAESRGAVGGSHAPSPVAMGPGECCKIPSRVWAEPRPLKGFLAF